MPAVLDRVMARRNDTAAKIDAEVVAHAKIVAAFRGIPLAEYLSEVLRAIVKRDLEAEMLKKQRSPSSVPLRKPKAGE